MCLGLDPDDDLEMALMCDYNSAVANYASVVIVNNNNNNNS